MAGSARRRGIAASVGLGLAILMLAAPPASAARKLITRSQTGSAPAGELATALAVCPPKTTLLGGGFSSVPDENPVILQASHRQGRRGWVAKGIRESEPTELTSYAYCRRGVPRLRQRRVTVPITVVASVVTETATARCPAGRRAVAGGFEAEVDFSGPFPRGQLVSSSWRSGRRTWSAVGTHAHDATTLDVTAYVYCSKRKRPRRAASIPLTGTQGAFLDTPACGRKALSGGFRTDPVDLEGDDNAILVLESRRVGKAWRSYGQHRGATSTGTLTSLAYCG